MFSGPIERDQWNEMGYTQTLIYSKFAWPKQISLFVNAKVKWKLYIFFNCITIEKLQNYVFSATTVQTIKAKMFQIKPDFSNVIIMDNGLNQILTTN